MRKNISLDDEHHHYLERVSEALGINHSKLIQQLLKDKAETLGVTYESKDEVIKVIPICKIEMYLKQNQEQLFKIQEEIKPLYNNPQINDEFSRLRSEEILLAKRVNSAKVILEDYKNGEI